MAEYILPDSPAWDDVKAAQNGDGTGTFWANSFLPFFGRLCAIAEYLGYDETKLGTTLGEHPLTFSGDGEIRLRGPVDLPDADGTINLGSDVYRIRSVSAPRTYTIENPTAVGQVLTIQKTSPVVQDVAIEREDASVICDFDSGAGAIGSVTLVARNDGGTPKWSVKTWAGNVGPASE